jgi:cysteine desulfuration protein SufE
MTWPPALQEVIDEFAEIEDAMERLEILMDFADEVDELPYEEWSDENLVKGCQSIAHIVIEQRDGTIWMRAAADAKMVQGLMGILTIAVNGGTAEQVLELTPDFVVEMGVLNTLTPSRSNGFRTMFDMIQKAVKEMK